jgi:hypothetical protein
MVNKVALEQVVFDNSDFPSQSSIRHKSSSISVMNHRMVEQ